MAKNKNYKNFGASSRKIENIPVGDELYFEQECDNLINLCDIIDEQNEINQQLLKNFIKMRLVSIVESNLKGLISELIDSQNLNSKIILEKNSIEIDLDILENLKNETYTKGKIIVAHLDKMNPGILRQVLNNINKLDSFKWLDDLRNLPPGYCYKFINKLNTERNDITHNLLDTRISTKSLNSSIRSTKNMILTLLFCTRCNIDIYDKQLSESLIEEYYGEFLNKLGHDQKKFKDITTKFRKKYKPYYKKY